MARPGWESPAALRNRTIPEAKNDNGLGAGSIMPTSHRTGDLRTDTSSPCTARARSDTATLVSAIHLLQSRPACQGWTQGNFLEANHMTAACLTREPMTAPPWPLRDDLELGALPTAAGCARLHDRQIVLEWGLPALGDTSELLGSQLVTNAIH